MTRCANLALLHRNTCQPLQIEYSVRMEHCFTCGNSVGSHAVLEALWVLHKLYNMVSVKCRVKLVL